MTPEPLSSRRITPRLLPTLLGLGLVLSTAIPLAAAPSGEETIELLKTYIALDTTNPPGNEVRGVNFLAALFDREGISYRRVESAPGRTSLWARLEGGEEPALILLHHIDVVAGDPRFWDSDPLVADIRDGHLYGRGALHAKGVGILHLVNFLTLHREKTPLRRDVIFMASADQEAGSALGARWIISNHPEAFAGAGFLLNEGRSAMGPGGDIQISVQVAQKNPLWLQLAVAGQPGHGSRPGPHSSVTRLLRGLNRILDAPEPPRLHPRIAAYFKAIAPARAQSPLAGLYRNMAKTVRSKKAMARLHREDPASHALLHNSCAITMLNGSSKINVIPPVATARLDCRLLPDEDPEQFIARLHKTLADPGIEITRLLIFPPPRDHTARARGHSDTELFELIGKISQRHYPGARVVPGVTTGFADSDFFRDIGIHSYGYSPMVVPRKDLAGIHGNNERVSLDNLKRGTQVLWEVIEAFVRTQDQ